MTNFMSKRCVCGGKERIIVKGDVSSVGTYHFYFIYTIITTEFGPLMLVAQGTNPCQSYELILCVGKKEGVIYYY